MAIFKCIKKIYKNETRGAKTKAKKRTFFRPILCAWIHVRLNLFLCKGCSRIAIRTLGGWLLRLLWPAISFPLAMEFIPPALKPLAQPDCTVARLLFPPFGPRHKKKTCHSALVHLRKEFTEKGIFNNPPSVR